MKQITNKEYEEWFNNPTKPINNPTVYFSQAKKKKAETGLFTLFLPFYFNR